MRKGPAGDGLLSNRFRLVGWSGMRASAAIAVLGMIASGSAAFGIERLDAVARRIATGAPLKIVAFGSSSTQGIGASSPQMSYPAQLQVDLGRMLPGQSIEVINRGVGGEDADDMMKRLDADAIAPKPDLVILQTGSNDPIRGVPLDRFVENTRKALLDIRARGIDTMLLEPQWCPTLERTPGAGAYRDAVRAIGAELGVPVIKRSSLMQSWLREQRITMSELLSEDGLHMRDGGYTLLAEAVAHEIIEQAALTTASKSQANVAISSR